MRAPDPSGLFNIIVKANALGIKITVDRNELSLKVAKGQTIDQKILEDIKARKEELISYLSQSDSTTIPDTKTEAALWKDGQPYYHLSDVERYWVNPDIDKDFKSNDRNHGVIKKAFMINGTLDRTALDKAADYLIERHESLRSTFHHFGNDYVMRIHRAVDIHPLEWIGDHNPTEDELNHFVQFEDDLFDLESGPLFKVRLVEWQPNHFTMTLKAHHVIMDTFSLEILMTELVASYVALKENKSPLLPALSHQLKDFLYQKHLNYSANYKRDQMYWKSKFPLLPSELIIPGAKKNFSSMKERVCGKQQAVFSQELILYLNQMAGKYSTTLFIVLQATFKRYLSLQTGQDDILIGTFVHGRDANGAGNQIGCFASSPFIRTFFSSEDSLSDAISKVIQSNLEMNTYTACTLAEVMECKQSDTVPIQGSVHKVNLLFIDESDKHRHLENAVGDLTIIPLSEAAPSLMPIDMYWLFIRRQGQLEINVEYDASRYETFTIKKLINEYFSYVTQQMEASC